MTNNKTITVGDVITDSIIVDSSNTITFANLDTDYVSVNVGTGIDGNILTISGDGFSWGSNVTCSDPFVELEERKQKEENDENLRNEHSVLQEAYNHYQLIKKLVEDNEIDKTFERRYEGFKSK